MSETGIPALPAERRPRGPDSNRSQGQRQIGFGPGFRLIALAVSLGAVALLGAPTARALPPGYAYEMVSPPNKNGGEIEGSPESLALAGSGAVTDDGGRVAYTSRASFAGAPANAITNSYMGIAPSPGGASWSTLPLTPPVAAQLTPVNHPGPAPVRYLSDDLTKAIVGTNIDPHTGVRQPRFNYYYRDLSEAQPEFTKLTPDPVSGSLNYTTISRPAFVGASENLNRVIYTASATLTADSVGLSGLKLYVVDTESGEVSLASRLGGTPGTPVAISGSESGGGLLTGKDHNTNAVSADGSVLFFNSDDVTAPGVDALYRRDLDAGQTVAVNAEENSTQSLELGKATFLDATPDGRFVFFDSDQPLVDSDTNTAPDVYRYDAAAPLGSRLTLVSVDQEPADDALANMNTQITSIGASESGDRLYFVTDGAETAPARQLVAGGPTGDPCYLYLWERGTINYVGSTGRCAFQSFQGGGSTRVESADVSPNGRYMVAKIGDSFFSGGLPPLTPPGDNGSGVGEIYLYDAEGSTPLEPDTVCISCRTTPGPELGDAFLSEVVLSMFEFDPKNFVSDGGRAVFSSPNSLLPQDNNGSFDVYMYEDDRLDLISAGRSRRDSFLLDANPSLETIAFVTADALVGWDIDGANDTYVAKLGGGLPEPPPRQPECLGEECQGAGSGAAPFGPIAPATSRLSGAEPPRSGGRARRCGARAKKAARSSRRARTLRRKAARAQGRQARARKRRAKRASQRAKRLTRRARACRRAGR